MFFYFGGDIILSSQDIINITLETKQSNKAKMLIDLLDEDEDYLFDVAQHFQDEQRYTVSLLSKVLDKISLEDLATMGFKEQYLNCILLVNRSSNNLDSYINKLIEEKNIPAIDIAIVILERNNINAGKLKEKRKEL